ncbi:hypothetical protein, partial [Crocosphaera watsonii]|uniref:hypothetical protein n=1 Tax=Crocosphaera watsonii TaxID=263511 RepID=UPI001E443AA7
MAIIQSIKSAASSTVLFADTESQLPSTTPGYDEAVSGDISGDPNNPLLLPLTERNHNSVCYHRRRNQRPGV